MLKDLREAQGKIADFKKRVTAAEDQLKRVDLRAPQAGVVHQLAIHTVGGVISNGETIMQIGPRADDLVLEAKVSPSDIDQVAIRAETAVRVLAGNQRTTPVITGPAHTRLRRYHTRPAAEFGAADPACYTVRIALPAEEVARLRDIHLLPGMSVESFIQTHERHCNTCSSRYKSRSRGRFASGENGAERL